MDIFQDETGDWVARHPTTGELKKLTPEQIAKYARPKPSQAAAGLMADTTWHSGPEPNVFGDVGSRYGNEMLDVAKYLAANATDVYGTNPLIPDVIERPAKSLGNLAMAGLLGLGGGIEKALGYAAELAPGDTSSEDRLARDLLGMWEAAGANPEARMLEMARGAGALVPTKVKASETASDIRNAVRNFDLPTEARSTHEVQPYASVGSRVSERQVGVAPGAYMPSADAMTEAERVAYANDPRRSWIDPATGKDILLQEVGADVYPTLRAQGVYDGPKGRETNPLFVGRSNATPEQLAATEALRGFADVQGGTPWTGLKMGDEPVMFVPHGGKGSIEDITKLEEAGKEFGFSGAYDVGDGYILTSFGGTPDTSAAARRAIGKATGTDPISTRVGGSYPAYEKAWQGGGVSAVRQLLDYLDNADPAAVERLNKSEAVSKRVQQKLMADFQTEKAAGGRMNPTVDEAVRTIARGPGWIDRLREMSDRFGVREIPLQMPTNLRDTGGLLNATHFGPANLSEIDPAFAGSNPVITGGERALPAPYPKQSYLGVDVG